MAITNLTGTSWKCKSTATSTNFGKVEIDAQTNCTISNAYSVNIYVPTGNINSDCLCWLNDSSISANNLFSLKLGKSWYSASTYVMALLNYNTRFYINGGADATNSVLISWLEANADRLDCTITNDIEHCTLSPLTGEVGVAYTGTLTAETGYSVPASVYVNGTLYAVTNNQFTVAASAVTGDFHVTGTIAAIKDVKLKVGTDILLPQTKVRNITDLTATASYSFASGRDTYASKKCTFAGGEGTRADREYEFVVGRYNKYNTDKQLFVVGNGTSDAVRNNAFTVYEDGNVEAAGTVNGTPAMPTEDGDYKLHVEGGVATWVKIV